MIYSKLSILIKMLHSPNNILKILLITLVFIGIYYSSYFVLHNDLGYNTDIARDLLILQDIVDKHKLPLIGPRTGGINGLFHGPLWPYINLPAFIIGKGNPVIIGWFWVILICFSAFLTYFVGKKVFNPTVGLLSAVLMSLYSVKYSNELLNPFGAILFSPIFFYFFYKYLKSTKISYLLLSFFMVGLMIQFEVAFGGPILVSSIFYLIFFLYKKKKLFHILSILILAIPLSTYILFDLRHDFLQFRSIISSIGSSTGDRRLFFNEIAQDRINGFINNFLAIPQTEFWFKLIIVVFFVYLGVIAYTKKNVKGRELILLFLFFYVSYWPLSFYLNGYVLDFHVLPFLPIALIILSSSYIFIRKEIFAFFYICIFLIYFTTAKAKIDSFNKYTGENAGSWRFSAQLAKNVYENVNSEFGFYVFTPDEWAYAPRYAIIYTQRLYPQLTANPYIKKPITIIVLAPTINGINNNREWWTKNRIKINKKADKIILFNNGYKIEKYLLNEEEIKIPSDPNLVNGLFFR